MNSLRLRPTLLGLVVSLVLGCADSAGPAQPDDVDVTLTVIGLRALDGATEGSYEAWVFGSDGTALSAGRFASGASGSVTLKSPIRNPARILVTVEPPGDVDDNPSAHELIGGDLSNGSASMTIVGHITAVSGLETDPGHHALFTPSNRFELGFPSLEDAGIWVFAPDPRKTTYGNYYLRLTPLRAGWIYEGWIVYDYGTPGECWVSYGKFLPDGFSLANSRDNTGLGVFSGQLDYVNAMPIEVDMPGDDWVDNIHNMPVPCGLSLPFDLNGDAVRGVPSRWTHVITIEPIADLGEPPLSERPFVVQPYRNPFGEGPPNEGRTVEYHSELVPSGTATIVP